MWGEQHLEDRDRRLAGLLLLLILVFVGAGLGTLGLGGSGSGEDLPGDNATATPTLTPETQTEPVSLTISEESRLLSVQNAVPGTDGTGRLVLRNTGVETGYLALSNIEVTDRENGQTDPEAVVDDSLDEGELSDALEVRLSVQYPDGSTVWVAGGPNEYVSLTALIGSDTIDGSGIPEGEGATVRLEYRLPSSAGNEVQTDSLGLDLTFTLRDVATLTTATGSG